VGVGPGSSERGRGPAEGKAPTCVGLRGGKTPKEAPKKGGGGGGGVEGACFQRIRCPASQCGVEHLGDLSQVWSSHIQDSCKVFIRE